MEHEKDGNELAMHQDGRVYPLGRALRSTFDADNHDTLGSDVTGLMIDLSKIPYDEAEAVAVAAIAPQPLSIGTAAVSPPTRSVTPPPPTGAPRSWATRLGEWIGLRHSI